MNEDSFVIDESQQPSAAELQEIFRAYASLGCLPALSPYPVCLEPFPSSENPPPKRYNRDTKRTKIYKMLPSPVDQVTPETSHIFLDHLQELNEPISFEIIGSRSCVTLQVVLQQEDERTVKSALEAAQGNSYFQEVSDHLYGRWSQPSEKEKQVQTEFEFRFHDYYLSPPFYFPLKTHVRSFPGDPLDSVCALFSKLAPEELGFYQVIFIPAKGWSWGGISRSLLALRLYEEKVVEETKWVGNINTMIPIFVKKTVGSGYHPSLEEHELSFHTGKAHEKSRDGNPFYAASIRVGLFASKEKSQRVLKSLKSALASLTPGDRRLKHLTRGAYVKARIHKNLHYYMFFNRVSFRPGMLLTTKELAGLVHFPTTDILKKRYPIEVAKGRHEAPDFLTKTYKDGIVIGKTVFRGQEKTITLPRKERLRHCHVIGASGGGKSTWLQNCILADIEQGTGVCLIDPHGDLIDRKIVPRIPVACRDRVIYFDPIVSPLRINVFEPMHGESASVLADDVVSILRRVSPEASTSWGIQIDQILSWGVQTILSSEQGGNLETLKDFLQKEHFRKKYLEGVKDEYVLEFWREEFPTFRKDAAGPAVRRIDPFLRDKELREILCHNTSSINFRKIMDEGMILLVKLSSIGSGKAAKLGSLLTAKLLSAARTREDIPEEERKQFYFWIDECQDFLCKSTAEILSGARKFGLGLVLAHQWISQLWENDDAVAKAVLSGPNIQICFTVKEMDAAPLARGFSHYTAEDLKDLDVGEAIAKVGAASNDFEIIKDDDFEEDPEREVSERIVKELIKQTQERYGTGVDTSVESESKDVRVTPEQAALEEKEKEEVISTEDFSRKGYEYTEKDVPKDTKIEITQNQRKFLEFLANSEELLPVRHLYTEIGFGGDTGHSLKGKLAAMGLITETNIHLGKAKSKSKILALTKKGYHALGLPPNPGKAGPLHRYLQRIVSERAEKKGYKSVIEESYEDGRSVDVGLTKDGIKTAVEISVTTRPDHIAKTIEHALDGGYHKVIALFIESNVLDQTKELAADSLSSEQISKVSFCLSEELDWLL